MSSTGTDLTGSNAQVQAQGLARQDKLLWHSLHEHVSSQGLCTRKLSQSYGNTLSDLFWNTILNQ